MPLCQHHQSLHPCPYCGWPSNLAAARWPSSDAKAMTIETFDFLSTVEILNEAPEAELQFLARHARVKEVRYPLCMYLGSRV